MGLWSRFTNIFKAKASRALDKAENPSETLDYSYNRQLETLQKVKRGVADVVTAKKRLRASDRQAGADRCQARQPGPAGDGRQP